MDKRLNAIISCVAKCNTLADIGTDHGLLCLNALTSQKASRVIATDISEKSLQKAITLLTENGYESKSDFRVGDGISVLDKDEADVIVVSGMGGREICKMICSANGFKSSFVLSPQSDVSLVRRTLVENGYKITKDFIVLSCAKYYDVISACLGEDFYTEFECEYGKNELRKQSEDYLSFLNKEIEKAKNLSLLSKKSEEKFLKRAKDLLKIKSEIYGG